MGNCSGARKLAEIGGRMLRRCSLAWRFAPALTFLVSRAASGAPHDSSPRRLHETIGTTSLEVAIQPGRLGLSGSALEHSIGNSLRAIATYYRALPIERVRVAVTPKHGGAINGSTRCGAGGGLVSLSLGASVDAAGLRDDWVVTHELLHVVFTSVEDEDTTHAWVGEGLATYVEPLVRARAGTLSEAVLWRDFLEGVPKGLPEAGDRGLDATHTWGRTYWGGALFWFEVDLLVRERTAGQKSIRDVLRALGAAGTNVCVDWSMERVLAAGDVATGTRVLSETYALRALTNAAPNLDACWRKLGVTLRDRRVVFDEGAPEAALRRAMTRD